MTTFKNIHSYKNSFIIVLCTLLIKVSYSQNLEIIPNMDELSALQVTTNDCYNFHIFSGQEKDINAYIRLSVFNNQNKTEAVLRTDFITIKKGILQANQILAKNPFRKEYTTSAFSNIINRSFLFPVGRYELCYELIHQENGVLDRRCLDIEVLNIYDLLLIYPYNEEAIVEKMPTFIWTPVMLSQGNIRYRIKWLESEKQELPSKSTFDNRLFHSVSMLSNNIYSYGATDPKLDKSKYYFWQVEAYVDNRLIVESEIWRFHFNQSRNVEQNSSNLIVVENWKANHIHIIEDEVLGLIFSNYRDNKHVKYNIVNNRNQIILTEKDVGMGRMKHGVNVIELNLAGRIEPNSSYTFQWLEEGKVKTGINFIKLSQ